jgi:hypothetical protein
MFSAKLAIIMCISCSAQGICCWYHAAAVHVFSFNFVGLTIFLWFGVWLPSMFLLE